MPGHRFQPEGQIEKTMPVQGGLLFLVKTEKGIPGYGLNVIRYQKSPLLD